MQSILIDDDPQCNETLAHLLKTHCPMVQILSMCTSGREGIEQIKKLQPDLVFLDIEMDGMSGLEMLLQLQPVHFEVIFVTGHHKYAQQAIRLSALDYLNKPPLAEEIMAAVLRASHNHNNREMFERYELFFNSMLRRQIHQKPSRIALPANHNTIEYIDIHTIIYIAADRAYATFHLYNAKQVVVSKNIGEYDTMLQDLGFYRVHRSYLVNLEHIRFYHKNEDQLELDNGVRLPVAKSEKEELLQRLSVR